MGFPVICRKRHRALHARLKGAISFVGMGGGGRGDLIGSDFYK